MKLLCHELSLAWGWPEVPLSPPDAAGAAPALLAQLAVALSPAWMAPEGPAGSGRAFVAGSCLSLLVLQQLGALHGVLVSWSTLQRTECPCSVPVSVPRVSQVSQQCQPPQRGCRDNSLPPPSVLTWQLSVFPQFINCSFASSKGLCIHIFSWRLSSNPVCPRFLIVWAVVLLAFCRI